MIQTVTQDGIIYELIPTVYNVLTNTYSDYEARVKGIDGCTKLSTNLIIPETVNGIVVRAIDTNAFKNCLQIHSVSIPDSIHCIKSSAFEYCRMLKSVESYHTKNASNTITMLGMAFKDCESLERVSFLSDVEMVSKAGFKNCTKLSQVDARIRCLGREAFADCIELDNLIFNNVTFLHTDAIKNCINLKTVTFLDQIDATTPKRNLQKIRKLKIHCTSEFNYLDWMYTGTDIKII